MRTCGVHPLTKPETSRFPRKELPHMPGSSTTPGRADARDDTSVCVAFRDSEHVGTRDYLVYAAQWLAYALPCRRFAPALADDSARLGADVDRYSFIVVDLHHLLLAGLPAHAKRNPSGEPASRLMGIASLHPSYDLSCVTQSSKSLLHTKKFAKS